jgi:hypothetical protein
VYHALNGQNSNLLILHYASLFFLRMFYRRPDPSPENTPTSTRGIFSDDYFEGVERPRFGGQSRMVNNRSDPYGGDERQLVILFCCFRSCQQKL